MIHVCGDSVSDDHALGLDFLPSDGMAAVPSAAPKPIIAAVVASVDSARLIQTPASHWES